MGAGLLAKAFFQSKSVSLTHRFREQARSHNESECVRQFFPANKKGSLRGAPGPKPAARMGRAWLSRYIFVVVSVLNALD